MPVGTALSEAMTETYTTIDSPLGPLLASFQNGSLAGLSFLDGRRPVEPAAHPQPRHDDDAIATLESQLEEYFAGERRTFEFPLALRGSDWELRVWNALLEIPYGHTRSYGEIAGELCNVSASRAVGLANARNPIALIVPCHRVIGADGSLTGYGGGLERKRTLLDLEAGRLTLALVSS
jgi:methylated-DNA-[protein]-cysteine S-methyltransferase